MDKNPNNAPKPVGRSAPTPSEVAARCHEIQTGFGNQEVPEFENLPLVGMGVRLALHIRGLPPVNYNTLRLVAVHLMGIPNVAVRRVVELLAELEFVKLQSQGNTINAVIPNVPYYETLYDTFGEYTKDIKFTEAEELSIALLSQLSKSPEKVDVLRSNVGAELQLLDRTLQLGQAGAYLRVHRSRGRDVVLSTTYFSENAAVYADMVAGSGSHQVGKIMSAIRSMQGIPLSVVEKEGEIAGVKLSINERSMLLRLAQDGAVRPPSIKTSHAGEQYFLFTPTPAGAALAPTKRDIYEKAMAIVAAIRQGQYLPKAYQIRSPSAVLYALKTKLRLGRATTEATQQYKNLVHLRVARLIPIGSGFSELEIIDTEENREALQIAYDLVDAGVASGTEVDESVRSALQEEYSFVESLVSAGELHRRKTVELTQQQQLEMDSLWFK